MTTTQHLWPNLPFGADGGYGTEGDVLPRVTETADHVDLNKIWDEQAAVLAEWNAHRTALVDLISYWHTSVADAVPQAQNESSFELATEFGEPTALRPSSEYVALGYGFDDFDRATRYTWRALRDLDSRQLQGFHDEALASDNRLVTGTILQRLFSNVPEQNERGFSCVGLWANDGMVPPNFLGKSFPSSHNHYMISGAVDIDSGDLLEAVKHVREHGFGLTDSNQKLLCMCNERESEEIQSFRANEANNNSAISKWDFIPASNQPAFVLSGGGQLVGNQPPGEVFNLPSVGSYGPVSIVESSFIPSGYFAVIATTGPGSSSNVIGVREHVTPAYRGLRQLPGNQQGYPLIESFYTRAFGVGTRYRGAAVVYQLKATGTYDVPAILV